VGIVTNVVLPLSLAFIMFTLGLGLTVNDFSRVARQPKDFLVGAASQIILLPVIAFVLVTVWPVSPEIALGVMIIAAAPGGVTSNLLTAFGRGDVALSISLTAVISILSVLTIPLIVVFSYGQFFGEEVQGEVSIAKTALSVFLIVTVPVLIGLATRRYVEGLSLRVEPSAKKFSTFLFALVLLGAIVQERHNIVEFYAQAGAITLTLNVVMLALAWILGAMFGSGIPQRIAISLECGLQNGTLAIAVATLLFGGATVIPAATYSLTMFATALIFIYFLRRNVMPAVP
jgi:BASS family bile acid:Na+ symporter